MAEQRQQPQPQQQQPEIRNGLDPNVAPKVKPGQSDKKVHSGSVGTGASGITGGGGGAH